MARKQFALREKMSKLIRNCIDFFEKTLQRLTPQYAILKNMLLHTCKNGSTALRLYCREAVLPLCVIASVEKLTFFPLYQSKTITWENIQTTSEKAAIEDFTARFQLWSLHFGSVWKDSGDRQSAPPESSVCIRGHSQDRFCYTGVCRSRPERTPIPAAISCSGS